MVKMRPTIKAIKPYEPGKPVEEVQRELGLRDVLKMASNENALGPSPFALRAVAEALTSVFYYPEGSCHNLRKALCTRLGVDMENIIIGNGSDELIKLTAEAFLEEGEEVIMAEHCFSEYLFATQLMGGRPVYVPRRGLRHDLDRMVGAVTERTKLIFICNPCNPTGTMVDRGEVERFLGLVPEHVLVVFDEAYHEYVSNDNFPDLISEIRAGRRNVIVLRTFSKVYGLAGLRIGYGVAHEEIIGWVNRVREPFNVNRLAQAAALAALDDAEHVAKSQRLVWEGKEYLYQALNEMGIEYEPTEANFVLINVRADARSVFKKLLARGIIVRPADIFGLPTHLRVTIGTLEQNSRFIEALKQVLSDLGCR